MGEGGVLRERVERGGGVDDIPEIKFGKSC